MMIDIEQIDDLASRLARLVPSGLRGDASQALRDELQQNFKSVLHTGLGKLDLVTREEFDVQRAVLLRTREKLEELRITVADLEAQSGATTSRAAMRTPPTH